MQTRIATALMLVSLAAFGCGGETLPPETPPTPPPPPVAATPATLPVETVTPTPPAPPPAPPLAELQLASLKVAADAINQHDARKYASIFARDAVHRESAAPDVVGREGIARRMQLLFSAFPDMKFSFDRVWQKGNLVVVLWRWTGTDVGGFIGRGPTGRQAGLQGVGVGFYNDDGLVREIHMYEDGQTAMDQLEAKAQMGRFRAPPSDAQGASPMDVIVATGGPEEGKSLATAKLFYEALENKKEADLLALVTDESTADDFAMSPKTAKGAKDWKAMYRSWTSAFGAFKHLPLLNQVAVNDYVIVERIVNGTQKGAVGPVKATGLPVTLHCVDIAQIKDGKIAHFWTWSNTLELIAQARPQPRPQAHPQAKKR